jgi:predicted transcriptional regulator of viral defense system
MAAGISSASRADLARLTGRGQRFIVVADAERELGLDREDARRRLVRWAEQGWLRRVRRDLYIPVPVDAESPESWGADPLVLADEVWGPCYVSGWTAANHWGLSEQSFRTTVIRTTRRVRQSTQRLLDNEFLLAHVTPENMTWGLRREWRDERRIHFADPARTVVDMLDDPSLGGGVRLVSECLGAYLETEDVDALITAADRLGNRAVFKRLGYLAERIGADGHLLDASEARLSQGFALLDPTQSTGGSRSRRWRIVANVQVDATEPS